MKCDECGAIIDSTITVITVRGTFDICETCNAKRFQMFEDELNETDAELEAILYKEKLDFEKREARGRV